jgi:hypothetical protein
MKILVHGISCVVIFIVVWSSVLDSSYFMLLGRRWLRDIKVSHDWGNNIITIQGVGKVRTIHVIKKPEAPTRWPEVLICYDFHSGIFDEEEDLMFATKLGLFSIGTIIVTTSVLSDQFVKLITLTCLNLIGHINKPAGPMFKPLVSFDVPIKPVHIQPVKIVIPLHTFQQHLPKTFSQHEMGEMEINKTFAQIKVQNLRIAS